MTDKSDKLIEALNRNTASNNDLSNSINDLVVVIETAEEWQEAEDRAEGKVTTPGSRRRDN